MHVMRQFVFAFALVFTTITPGLAQRAPAKPEHLAAAKELMEASGAAKQFDAIMPMIMNSLGQTIIQVAPDKSSQIQEVLGMMMPRFSARKQELIDQIAVLYTEKFTIDELKTIVAFFKTPVGTKLTQSQAEMFQQSMALGQVWGQKIGKEIDEEVRKELRNRGIKI